MPTTINGVGTHYYGKRNKVVRIGTCRACGRTGNLTSYDTRLWIVVVFVPVIPLGRKRIIDECSSCRRHFQAQLDKFAMGQQLSVSGGRDQYRSEHSPEAALTAHAQMLMVHAPEEAVSLRQEALADFPDDAALHAGLAGQLDELGDYNAATPLFERALELDPQLPEAREGMGLRRIVDGKLDEARKLLDFLEQPGAGQVYSLRRLDQLAAAYQKAGRHEDVVALCRVLIREFPNIGQQHDFRKFVAKSEQRLGRGASALPAKEGSLRELFSSHSGKYSRGQRWAAYLTLVTVLAALGLAILNEYRRQHRNVIVRNEFGQLAKVAVDGNIVAMDGIQSQLELPEGVHHVRISGAINDEFDLDMRAGYFQRWTHDPVWIINVGGAAALANETLYYATNPRPSETAVSIGESTFSAPHVDYLFEEPPSKLEMSSESAEITKRRLSFLMYAPRNLFEYALVNSSRDAALRFAESRLVLHPDDDDLLHAYAAATSTGADASRAEAFLKGHLDDRPVVVNWHRMYQELHPGVANKKKLSEEYDALLQKEPANGALLYLRGRLAPDTKEAVSFYERSIAADAELGWPWFALGYNALSEGDWARAKECFEKAAKLRAGEGVDGLLMMARLGLGEADALATEYREQITTAGPVDAGRPVMLLATVLASQGDEGGAMRALDDWEASLPIDDRPGELLQTMRAMAEYTAGDFEGFERRVAAGQVDATSRFFLLLATGKADRAAADGEFEKLRATPLNALALSVALELAGKSSEAAAWREKAAESFAALNYDEVRAAEMLRRDTPPTREELDEYTQPPLDKALLLAALALKFPEQHAELAGMAARLAVEPGWFRPLIAQTIERAPEPKAL